MGQPMGDDDQKDGWGRFEDGNAASHPDKTPSVDRVIKQSGAAVRDSASGPPDKISKFENRRVSGFDRIGGKWSKADGLISRGGYRRILPESRSDSWLLDYQIEELEDVAKEVLRERWATVFESLVLDPLRGKPGKTIDDLARQFGVSAEQISRIKYKCKLRVEGELDARREAFAKKNAPEADETCEVCGRTYGAKAWPEKRAQMEAEYREMVTRREAEEAARWQRQRARYDAEASLQWAALKPARDRHQRWRAYYALHNAGGNDEAQFETALAEFRLVVAGQNPSLLGAFDLVSNIAREADTDDAFWAAVEALWDVAEGDAKAALDRAVFQPAK